MDTYPLAAFTSCPAGRAPNTGVGNGVGTGAVAAGAAIALGKELDWLDDGVCLAGWASLWGSRTISANVPNATPNNADPDCAIRPLCGKMPNKPFTGRAKAPTRWGR